MPVKTKKAVVKSKVKAEPKAKVKIKVKAEPKAKVKIKVKAEVKVKPKAKVKVKVKAELKAKPTPSIVPPLVKEAIAPKPVVPPKPIVLPKVVVPPKPAAPLVRPVVTPKPVIMPKVPVPPKAAVPPKPVVPPKPPVPPPAPAPKKELKEIELKLPITVKDLAIKLQEKPSALIKLLMEMRVMAGINQNLDQANTAALCEKLGFTIKQAPEEEELILQPHRLIDKAESLLPRSPIVTFMGHVDHGKTSLLDAIRKSKVVDSEHGGITQHIGAYRVRLPNGEITFLDTPGHEAFTAMRARGASVTDIVVLVVAADDGVMPQTQEAIDHARAAGVSIIVALNKIDKPGANPDQVKRELSKLGLTPEEWQGKTITVPVSAKTGEGVDNLLEMILMEAQMLELKANPNRLAQGVVIEAKMSKGRGPVATILVRNGTLLLNDTIIVGKHYGKIRAMFDDRGRQVSSAGPSVPVEVLGLDGVPLAGQEAFVIEDEKQARSLALMRQEAEKERQMKSANKISLEELHAQIKAGKIKELKLIVKADVQGSLEAIKDVLSKINTEEIKMGIIHEGVGNINSSDVILAVASNALIIGFNITADERAKELSDKEGIEIKIYNIIYELGNEIKAALEGMLEPKLKKVFLGRAEVRKVFSLSRSGVVAGCFVTKGKISRSVSVSLIRNGEVVYEGGISNLKRFKDDVRDVAEGFECGISLSGYNTYQEGDVIEAYEMEKIARKL